VFRWFENRVTPYPEAPPPPLPTGFFAFLWACSQGLRPYILAMTLCTAVIGAFEALLFAMLGRIVDWLAKVAPSRLWTEERRHAVGARRRARRQRAPGRAADDPEAPDAGGELPDAPALELPPPAARPEHELLPGRVRRRVAAKVMQTALAVRDTWFTVADSWCSRSSTS